MQSEELNSSPQETLHNALKGTTAKVHVIDHHYSVLLRLMNTNKDLRSNYVVVEGAERTSSASVEFMSNLVETMKAKMSGELENPDVCSKFTTKFIELDKHASVLVDKLNNDTPTISEAATMSLEKTSKSLKENPPKLPQEFKVATSALNLQRMTFELLKELPGEHHAQADEKLKQINLAIENMAMEQRQTQKASLDASALDVEVAKNNQQKTKSKFNKIKDVAKGIVESFKKVGGGARTTTQIPSTTNKTRPAQPQTMQH